MRLFLLCAAALLAQPRRVAITVDDLPRGGDARPEAGAERIEEMTRQLTGHLRGTSAIGFVNPSRYQSHLDRLLAIWVANGLDLGNHSYSHLNINTTPVETYCGDVAKAEPAIQRALGGRKPVYYRHPFLRTGKDLETKAAMAACLQRMGYTVAPVTHDNSEWLFAAVYARIAPARREAVKREYIAYMDRVFAYFEERSRAVLGREIPQILLIHANQLNADAMPDLLRMMRARGYGFVTLREALADPAYELPDTHTGVRGPSWIQRWGKAMGIPEPREVDEPEWILEEYRRLQ